MANISPLEALGDPTRRQIFERIRQGHCSVSELISIVPISQPAVSQHLKVLRDAQLVRVEKRGQQRINHLNPVGLAELRRYAESLWEDVLRAFGEEAERMADTSKDSAGGHGHVQGNSNRNRGGARPYWMGDPGR